MRIELTSTGLSRRRSPRERAPQGVVAFTALPVRLALETLAEVERRGAGAKVSREQVAEALSEVQALLRGERNLEAVLRTP